MFAAIDGEAPRSNLKKATGKSRAGLINKASARNPSRDRIRNSRNLLLKLHDYSTMRCQAGRLNNSSRAAMNRRPFTSSARARTQRLSARQRPLFLTKQISTVRCFLTTAGLPCQRKRPPRLAQVPNKSSSPTLSEKVAGRSTQRHVVEFGRSLRRR